jgi:hypothetical protein
MPAFPCRPGAATVNAGRGLTPSPDGVRVQSEQHSDSSADALLVQALISQDVWGRLHAASTPSAAPTEVQPSAPMPIHGGICAGAANAAVAGLACIGFAAPTHHDATPLAAQR